VFQSLESGVARHGLGRHLDVDGLTRFVDPVQQQVDAMKNHYESLVGRLRQEVSELRTRLAQGYSTCSGDLCNLDLQFGNVGHYLLLTGTML